MLTKFLKWPNLRSMAKAKKAAKPAPKKKTSAKPAKAAKSAKSLKSAKPAKAKVVAKPAKPAPKAQTKVAAKATKPAGKAAKVQSKPEPKAKASVKEAKVKELAKDKKAAKVVEVEVPAPVEMEAPPEEVVLTDAEGRRYCRVKDCDQLAMVDTYCRYHYLLYWKRIQVRKKILTEGKLERYIEELTARYPDKFLDMLRKDLRSEKEFVAAIQELEIDESQGENEFEEESENFIEEVRGISSEPASTTDDDF
ncbi:MAG: hypothetical protein AB7K41_06210 [Bdellovibrionales bacterium]